MKIAVECKSPLLQKSLELFLSSHLVSLKQCEIVVRDFKSTSDDRTFYISKDKDADLIKPFSKSALILALEARYKKIAPKEMPEKDEREREVIEKEYGVKKEGIDFSILERRIDSLTKEYQQNILKAVKAFYEK